MNKTPTYKEQFDKLTRAYINGEVNPNSACSCFVGNILNRNGDWSYGRNLFMDYRTNRVNPSIEGCSVSFLSSVIKDEANGYYYPMEIIELEKLFLNTYYGNDGGPFDSNEGYLLFGFRINENALFKAFEVTLELLKQIHISKGEVIDETPVFQKRQLKTV